MILFIINYDFPSLFFDSIKQVLLLAVFLTSEICLMLKVLMAENWTDEIDVDQSTEGQNDCRDGNVLEEPDSDVYFGEIIVNHRLFEAVDDGKMLNIPIDFSEPDRQEYDQNVHSDSPGKVKETLQQEFTLMLS